MGFTTCYLSKIEAKQCALILCDENVSGLLHIDKVADFIDYYNTLTPSQKCTVHPPAGSGAGYGIYNLPSKNIIEKWLRKQ